MANLVNAEAISKAYGTRTLLDDVSLGLSRGDVIGVTERQQAWVRAHRADDPTLPENAGEHA